MSKTTRLMAVGGLAAGLLIGGFGVASATTPAPPAKAWSHGELTTSQVTDVTWKKKRFKGKRYGKRYGWRGRYAQRHWHPRRHGHRYGRYGWAGPRVGVYVGPRYRYRHWW